LESASIAAPGVPSGAKEGDKGLKSGALGYLSNLVIGVASTAPAKVDYEVELVPEHPAHALMDVADRRSGRMIVVGSHGESPLKGTALGSTRYKLVHSSQSPVLVVRA
jgi:nucleotide-binding universal stress UspA family protein